MDIRAVATVITIMTTLIGLLVGVGLLQSVHVKPASKWFANQSAVPGHVVIPVRIIRALYVRCLARSSEFTTQEKMIDDMHDELTACIRVAFAWIDYIADFPLSPQHEQCSVFDRRNFKHRFSLTRPHAHSLGR